MKAFTRHRRSGWPIALLALASTMAAWNPVWANVPMSVPLSLTGEVTAWESPTAPPPESSAAPDPGSGALRGSAGERLAYGAANERILCPAPGTTPPDRSLRTYPSRASPV